jgi:general secretion pathway protein A
VNLVEVRYSNDSKEVHDEGGWKVEFDLRELFHPRAPINEMIVGRGFSFSFTRLQVISTAVYLEYYGLTEPPFNITPNPRFLFYSAKHREAFNHLLYGIRERKGFVQLTGEVGTGKSTLCRAMLDELGNEFATALILNPVLDSDQLMKAVAMEFGLNVKGFDRLETVAAINLFLLHQVEHGRDAVLIIDEAHDLTDELLEQVRLLSNLETDDRKLLQIVLMGQPELRVRLNNPRLRQLRQRITVRYHLRPLRRQELGQYVQHRLQVSGANGAPYFTGPALWRIHLYSGGIPRLINALCDKCLLAGYVQQRDRVDFRMVGTAIRELEGKIDV